VLDNCNFHECVDLNDFKAMKTLAINPPDLEFLVINCRINEEFPENFRIYPYIDETTPFKI
jgi:AP-4 complex subunit mu-1